MCILNQNGLDVEGKQRRRRGNQIKVPNYAKNYTNQHKILLRLNCFLGMNWTEINQKSGLGLKLSMMKLVNFTKSLGLQGKKLRNVLIICNICSLIF